MKRPQSYYRLVINHLEREFLMREILRQNGNRRKTADALGVSYRTLIYRTSFLGITRSEIFATLQCLRQNAAAAGGNA